MPLPLIKFGVLLVRTVAKPFASALKERAKTSPTFERLWISIAQTYHQAEVRLRRNLLGYKTDEVVALDKDKAIQLGAEMVSELTLLLVACGAVYFEYARSRGKEIEKEEKYNRVMKAASDSVEDLKILIEGTIKENQGLRQKIDALIQQQAVLQTQLHDFTTSKKRN